MSQPSQSLLARGSWFFVLCTDLSNYGSISIDALLHSLYMRWLIDLTYWNYISLIFFFYLSLTLPFICILDIALQPIIRFFLFVYVKKISVATMIWLIYHILIGFFACFSRSSIHVLSKKVIAFGGDSNEIFRVSRHSSCLLSVCDRVWSTARPPLYLSTYLNLEEAIFKYGGMSAVFCEYAEILIIYIIMSFPVENVINKIC